eukprot:3700959-Pyramimonas_sp.AAC.1
MGPLAARRRARRSWRRRSRRRGSLSARFIPPCLICWRDLTLRLLGYSRASFSGRLREAA